MHVLRRLVMGGVLIRCWRRKLRWLRRPPAAGSPTAPPQRQQANRNTYSSNEIVDAGHKFFGTSRAGWRKWSKRPSASWGQPNGYILGEEAGGAFVAGLRYGEGTLYTKNAGDLRVFWQGPSIGFDTGGEGARTMMLVYNLPATEAIYEPLRRHRRLRLFHRRLRHDGADRQ